MIFRKTKGYWYKTFITECPVCGRGSKWRERQFTKKPKNPSKRISYTAVYDHCEG